MKADTHAWLWFEDTGCVNGSAPNTYRGSLGALEHYQCPHSRSNQKWRSVKVSDRLKFFRGIGAEQTAYIIPERVSG